ncbi:MAG: type II toxin-antitoxin system HigB family toxin [Candidatus Marinimicrobia bacterium]|nr:type II toxin-antitoxin system HigB family toxin [Candidatus Neomarinimicrobiota bacterium]
MRIIARSTIKKFYEKNRDAEASLRAWYFEAKNADWSTPQDIKNQYRSASFVHNNRVVFNIAGNKYRLVVAIKYDFDIVYIRFIGTHAEYDSINIEKV